MFCPEGYTTILEVFDCCGEIAADQVKGDSPQGVLVPNFNLGPDVLAAFLEKGYYDLAPNDDYEDACEARQRFLFQKFICGEYSKKLYALSPEGAAVRLSSSVALQKRYVFAEPPRSIGETQKYLEWLRDNYYWIEDETFRISVDTPAQRESNIWSAATVDMMSAVRGWIVCIKSLSEGADLREVILKAADSEPFHTDEARKPIIRLLGRPPKLPAVATQALRNEYLFQVKRGKFKAGQREAMVADACEFAARNFGVSVSRATMQNYLSEVLAVFDAK